MRFTRIQEDLQENYKKMDIQGYIIDHWLGKMSAEKPVLIIYDRNALYHSVLPLAEEKGVKVIDTTKGLLHARLAASRFWCGELAENNELRMIIYRQMPQPTTDRQWVEEPYSAFKNAAAMFPVGPQDDYKYICQSFLPTKKDEIERLFGSGTTSFNMINALLDGAAYPALEQLTGGKSFVEMTVGLLAQTVSSDMAWLLNGFVLRRFNIRGLIVTESLFSIFSRNYGCICCLVSSYSICLRLYLIV